MTIKGCYISEKYSYLTGFSLIELIVVIMLIGIFTTMALTRTDTLTTIKEQIAIDQITNDTLVLAQWHLHVMKLLLLCLIKIKKAMEFIMGLE